MRITAFSQASAVSGLAFLLLISVQYALANDSVVITDPTPGDKVYFSSESSDLSPEGRETLRRQARWLKENPSVTIMIEGHTDDWGSRPQNFRLGQKRAEEVRRFLIGLGIEAQRISVISYGEDRPAALCKQEQCWSHNRRAVTIITSGAKID